MDWHITAFVLGLVLLSSIGFFVAWAEHILERRGRRTMLNTTVGKVANAVIIFVLLVLEIGILIVLVT